MLQFRHNNPSFPLLSLSPIKVTTKAVRLRFANAPPVRVAPAELFSVSVEAVDAAGNRDDSERGAVRMKAVSGGANGNGGDLLNDLSASNLAVKPTAGLAAFRPSFTQACAGCRLQFTDTDTTLDSLTSEPIMITGVVWRVLSRTHLLLPILVFLPSSSLHTNTFIPHPTHRACVWV